MEFEEKQIKLRKARGRPAGKKSIPIVQTTETDLSYTEKEHVFPERPPLLSGKENIGEVEISSRSHQSAFSALLTSILKGDRAEVLRIAREVGVSENTVYRWLNGSSVPRTSHLQALLNVLFQTRQTILMGSKGILPASSSRSAGMSSEYWDVQKEVYRRVLEQAATTLDDISRRWHIIETIFEYALLQLDPEHHGLALAYARLMPPSSDGFIHSLYESEMRGQGLFAFSLDCKTYLGSTTLAGAAASFQRVQIWSVSDTEGRTPVGFDEHEASSCAAPVMRGGRIAGVLIVSSAQSGFVRHSVIARTVTDYSNLLAVALTDNDFYAISQVRLVPMPDLAWQRDLLRRSYLNRVIECARKGSLSLPEAEQMVLQDMEEEFEREAAGSWRPENVEVSKQPLQSNS